MPELIKTGARVGVAMTVIANIAMAEVDFVRPVFTGNQVPNPLSGAVADQSYGQITGFTYDPDQNTLYVSTTGALGAIHRFTDLGLPTQTGERLVTTSQWTDFTFGKQPVAQGMALNPVRFDGHDPYTVAAIVDGHGLGTSGQPATSRRLYQYDLQPLTPSDSTTAWNGHLTPLLSAADLNAAGGNAAATGSGTAIRQPRFGNDERSIYFQTSASTVGGLFRYDAASDAVTRISADRSSTEVAVRKISATTDRIYYSNADDALMSIEYNHATNQLGAPKTELTQSQIAGFVRLGSGSLSILNIVSDDAGNVYFYANNAGSRSLFLRYDTNGRLAKAATINEIRTVRSSHPVTTYFTQIHGSQHTGGKGTFDVDELWFGAFSTTAPLISAVKLFEPGDFDRDGDVDSADATLLGTSGVIKTVGATTTDNDAMKFDLNGDGVNSSSTFAGIVDYHDVKAFQQFFDFEDGDADFDQLLDFDDLQTVQAAYLQSGKVWTDGDFTGDNLVSFDDLQLLADTWLGLGQLAPTTDDLDTLGFAGGFRNDVIEAFNIPEPASLGLLGLAGAMMTRRRRT